MIIVTGTKRSGTSMWMQLLNAAGYPPIGDAFPRNWETTIKDANPGGFFESKLRRGIYYETNPDPATGTYLFPEQTRRHAVKVFIPGLIKTDRAFIDRVVATVRPWRQYVRSLHRLYAMEDESRKADPGKHSELPPPTYMAPVIEWWVQNFSLISDIVTRRYPFYMVAYDSVLAEPNETLAAVFEWLGDGDVEAACKAVAPSLRTQDDVSDESSQEGDFELEGDVIETFDTFYEIVLQRRPLEQAFVDRLNATNQRLEQSIAQEIKRVTDAQLERKRLVAQRRRQD